MTRQRIYDYFILVARFLIAWTFLRYGWSKLNNNQFGISLDEMKMPIKDLGIFKLSWYLFNHEPFKSFVGVSQILAGLLILYNRTLILGVLFSLPIFLNILIINITYIKMTGFYWRISYYLFLEFLILWHYREKVIVAFKTVYIGISTKFKYPLCAYLILPFMAILLEIAGILPKLITNLILNPSETFEQLSKLPSYFTEMFKK